MITEFIKCIRIANLLFLFDSLWVIILIDTN